MPGKKCRTTKCTKCGKDFGEEWSDKPIREPLTGKWICVYCWYHTYYKKRPDSTKNIIKQLRNTRTGNLDPNCTTAKGNKFEELSDRLYGFESLNKKNDNYTNPIDSIDPKTGLLYQTKGSLYDSSRRSWHSNWENDHNKEFYKLIYHCASKDGKIIERIYEFTKEEVIKRVSIEIFKNPSRVGWYDSYRVNDEEILKKANEIFKILGV